MTEQYFLSWALTMLPLLFVFTTSSLISWGILTSITLKRLLNRAGFKSNKFTTRKTDRINYTVSVSLVMFLTISLILVPLNFVMYVDIFLLMNLWIFVYYFIVSFQCIKDPHYMLFGSSDQQLRSSQGPDCAD